MQTPNPESVLLNGKPYLVYKNDKGIAIKVSIALGDKEHQVWRQFAFSFTGTPHPMPIDAFKAILLCDMN